jgi:tRNA-specific 2-thiouridylase
MRVATALRIPFREIDLSEEYQKEVVGRMVADYARGVTPNPDVLCNSAIKFGHFFRWARGEGADYVATGHYARSRRSGSEGDCADLLRGADSSKDQSYFLWQLGQNELMRTLFPIGHHLKREVRVLAKKFGLANAEKRDSQGLCFLGDVSMDEFLARFLPLEKGLVLDTEGRAMGEHRGAALYTIGQRHGFSEGAPHTGRPQYVVSVDTQKNTLTISSDRMKAARRDIALMSDHWINGTPRFPLEALAQARYRETPVKVRAYRVKGELRVAFEEPHLLSAGQSLVFYEGERCLGGGVIAP